MHVSHEHTTDVVQAYTAASACGTPKSHAATHQPGANLLRLREILTYAGAVGWPPRMPEPPPAAVETEPHSQARP